MKKSRERKLRQLMNLIRETLNREPEVGVLLEDLAQEGIATDINVAFSGTLEEGGDRYSTRTRARGTKPDRSLHRQR